MISLVDKSIQYAEAAARLIEEGHDDGATLRIAQARIRLQKVIAVLHGAPIEDKDQEETTSGDT